MQLTSGVEIPDGLLAAMPQLAENSRQGFEQITGTMHWASGFVISHTSLGIIGPLYDTCTESRYTGKERDAESGNDYFGARYYASTLGRWMSPDWAAQAEPVPYAKLDDPQSLNLYGYVQNNPLSNSDPDGHDILATLRNMDPFDADSIQNSFPLDPIFPDIDAQMSADRQAAEASPQNATSTANANPNAAAEQHQYDLVVERTNKLLGSTDASDHIDPNGTLDGGNYAFPINNNDKSDAAFRSSLNKALGEKDGTGGAHGGLTPPTHRVGFSTSLHHDNNALHVDHFNGAQFPVGTLLHGIVDVGIGHLPYYGSNHAFSYAGVQ